MLTSSSPDKSSTPQTAHQTSSQHPKVHQTNHSHPPAQQISLMKHLNDHQPTSSPDTSSPLCVLLQESEFHLYTLYNKNKPKSDDLMMELGKQFFRVCALVSAYSQSYFSLKKSPEMSACMVLGQSVCTCHWC